ISSNSIDAKVWAVEFMNLFGEKREVIDEGLMIAWFANAIMNGFDEATRREQKRLDLAKAALEGIVVRAARIRKEKASAEIDAESFFIEYVAAQALKEMA
ncbi:MAG: hypothetical protein OEV08_07455, partial [Nitrospira sp.]|nr:hypothetical protein [Nitrospira sp.]